jgi:hypothetical protein
MALGASFGGSSQECPSTMSMLTEPLDDIREDSDVNPFNTTVCFAKEAMGEDISTDVTRTAFCGEFSLLLSFSS